MRVALRTNGSQYKTIYMAIILTLALSILEGAFDMIILLLARGGRV